MFINRATLYSQAHFIIEWQPRSGPVLLRLEWGRLNTSPPRLHLLNWWEGERRAESLKRGGGFDEKGSDVSALIHLIKNICFSGLERNVRHARQAELEVTNPAQSEIRIHQVSSLFQIFTYCCNKKENIRWLFQVRQIGVQLALLPGFNRSCDLHSVSLKSKARSKGWPFPSNSKRKQLWFSYSFPSCDSLTRTLNYKIRTVTTSRQ